MRCASYRWPLVFCVLTGLLIATSWVGAQVTVPRFDQEATDGELPLIGDVDAAPLSLVVQAGGELVASELKLGDHCRGYISKASTNVRVYFEQAENAAIEITLESNRKNGLVINSADGQWHCAQSDDQHRSVVRIDAPTKGQIDIWAANFDAQRRDDATLTVRPILP